MNRSPICMLFAAVLSACGQAQPSAGDVAGTAPSYLRKVKFKAADAAASFAIKIRQDGAKLVDASENELARIHLEADGHIRFKDATDQPLGAVTGSSPQWHLKDAAHQQVLFQLVRQDDGDLKLQDGAGKLLFRIKVRDYGAEIETADDRSLFKSKHKDGGLSIRDAADTTVLRSNDPCDAQAAALLVLPDLTLPQRVALWYLLEQPAAGARTK